MADLDAKWKEKMYIEPVGSEDNVIWHPEYHELMFQKELLNRFSSLVGLPAERKAVYQRYLTEIEGQLSEALVDFKKYTVNFLQRLKAWFQSHIDQKGSAMEWNEDEDLMYCTPDEIPIFNQLVSETVMSLHPRLIQLVDSIVGDRPEETPEQLRKPTMLAVFHPDPDVTYGKWSKIREMYIPSLFAH
jgi:hypothetical protein